MVENQDEQENKKTISDTIKNNTDEDYGNRYPPGYWFCPSDEQLIMTFLKPKTLNQPLAEGDIRTVHRLCNYTPQEISDTYKAKDERVTHFFTLRYEDAISIRKTVNGTWKFHQAEIHIGNRDHPIGYKRKLQFFEGFGKDQRKTKWVMLEYRMPDMKMGSWLACKVYNKEEFDPRRFNLETETTVLDGVTDTKSKRQPNLQHPLRIGSPTMSHLTGEHITHAELSGYAGKHHFLELQADEDPPLSKRPCVSRSYTGENRQSNEEDYNFGPHFAGAPVTSSTHHNHEPQLPNIEQASGNTTSDPFQYRLPEFDQVSEDLSDDSKAFVESLLIDPDEPTP